MLVPKTSNARRIFRILAMLFTRGSLAEPEYPLRDNNCIPRLQYVVLLYLFPFTESANCLGVRPAACTSSSKGREILPSGRTGKVAVRSFSFHTAMCSTSSGPMTYSGPARLVEAAFVALSVVDILADVAVLSEAELAADCAGASWANAILVISI